MQYLKIAIAILLLVILLSLFTMALDSSFTSPFHELGHAAVGTMLGVQVTRIEWGRTYYISPNDWRENIMGFAGGIIGALALTVLYMIANDGLEFFANRVTRERLKRVFISAKFSIKIAATADLMVQLTAGVLEGSNKKLYDGITNNLIALFAIFTTLTAISLALHIVRMSHSDVVDLASKTHSITN